MKVFVSHAHTDRDLADAWGALLSGVFPKVKVFYSSEMRPGGGIGAGRWRDAVLRQLKTADRILVFLTPQSIDSPWVLFEYGYARGLGQDGRIYPLLFWIDENDLRSPVRDLQTFRGDRPNELGDLLGRIARKSSSAGINKSKASLIEAYARGLEASRAKWLDPLLFSRSFHNEVAARRLEGDWFVKWTVRRADGETALPTDILRAVPTRSGTRFRMLSTPHVDAETALEGVISSRGHVALCWWAGSGLQACGTAILEITANHQMMEGTWEGFAALEPPFADLSREGGRIVLGRERSSVEQG
ncbi:MAG: toll/interleukin-1 receptor domain-containing protein [Hyphomicrobiaceae bacterium]